MSNAEQGERPMKSKLRPIMATAAAVAVLTGCSQNNFRDVEDVPSQDADSYAVLNNVDGHPNLVRVCQDGVAFLTTTRDYTAVQRVAEWDDECPR